MNRARAIWASLITLVLVTVSACATLPTEGEPHSFAIEVPARDPIGQYGSGPQVGSSPTVLVDDFLRACAAGAFDDYATAKLYLLPETADRWQPSAQVIVFPTDSAPSTRVPMGGEEAQSVTVEVPTLATVDATGLLHELPKGGETTVTFELVKDSSGEWRISDLDDGVVLSQNSFTTSFGHYDVYFPAITRDALVTDPRWLPRSRNSSHLVNAVLQGPSPLLEEAVVSDLGTGLALPTSGVNTRDRVAYVDLQGEAQKTREERDLLLWQIHQTLRQVPNVQATVLTVNSVMVDPQGMPSGPDYALDRLVSITDGALAVGTSNVLSELVPEVVLQPDSRFPAIGPLEDSPAAWLGPEDNTVYVMRSPTGIVEVEIPSPSTPSIDRFGNVWVVGDGGEALFVIGPSNEPVELESPLSNASLSAVYVAPDGARIALLGGSGEGGALWTGTIVPDRNETFRIVSVQEMDRVNGDVIDATWNGPATLSALVAGDGDAVTVVNVPLGSWSSRFNGPSEGAWISAVQPGGLIVQREDQTAFQRTGAAWRDLGQDRHYLNSAG